MGTILKEAATMPIVRITLPAEKRALREKMRALGLGHREIAAEFARRYRLRPRTAWRKAHGWSLRGRCT